jgi:asparagine synthase (glutamine-hydrolysing)
MCGIAGAVVRPESLVDLPVIDRMLDSLAHRGPDGRGTARYSSQAGDRVLLGHRRLAIIDPVGGKQPMCDERRARAHLQRRDLQLPRAARGAQVRASSRSTRAEVLLRAYSIGARRCERLRGMFASPSGMRRASAFIAAIASREAALPA